MAVMYFTGYVEPRNIELCLENLPPFFVQNRATGETRSFQVAVSYCVVSVECVCSHFDRKKLSEIANKALDIARSAVDLVAFQSGYGLSVHLDKFINPEGIEEAIMPKMETLGLLCTSYGMPDLERVYAYMVETEDLGLALRDLIAAITIPHHAEINCARAIEGIRILMFPKETNKRQAWAMMQKTLHFDHAYLSYVTELSVGPRHGDRIHRMSPTLEETLKRSWQIMNRYLEFKKRNEKPLLLSEFPLLRG